MFLNEYHEIFEAFRGFLPFYVAVCVPIFILLSPVNPVNGAHEFSVYRMQQFDLQGTPHGSRSAQINLEARTLDSSSFTRRAVLARLSELSPTKYKEVVTQLAGGLVVLLPGNLTNLSKKDKESVLELESFMLEEQTQVPVYFAMETPELDEIYSSVQGTVHSDGAGSAFEALLGSVSATGFQFVSSSAQSKAMSEVQLYNIQGKLTGFGIEEQLPTVVVVAHYDSFGVAPSLSFGADSNASGVAALLELARLFSKLYSNSRTHPRFNLLFLLSAAGKLNFQGTRKWLEDYLENSESSPLTDVAYVLCLDSLGRSDDLYLHVSKPPKDGNPGAIFYQGLQQSAERFFPGVKVDVVHKKINLAEENLAWEHERFSMRRLPAFTLSHYSGHRDLLRNSILDTREQVEPYVLSRNIKVIAETLAHHMYNLSHSEGLEIFSKSLRVEEANVGAWLNLLSSQPRSPQLLASTTKPTLVKLLEKTLGQFTKEVQVSVVRPDKRESEFTFYDVMSTSISAYSVRHAVFDLFLTALICIYLGLIYLAVEYFSRGYVWLLRNMKTKSA